MQGLLQRFIYENIQAFSYDSYQVSSFNVSQKSWRDWCLDFSWNSSRYSIQDCSWDPFKYYSEDSCRNTGILSQVSRYSKSRPFQKFLQIFLGVPTRISLQFLPRIPSGIALMIFSQDFFENVSRHYVKEEFHQRFLLRFLHWFLAKFIQGFLPGYFQRDSFWLRYREYFIKNSIKDLFTLEIR